MFSVDPHRLHIREGEKGGRLARQANDIIILIDVLRATTTITTALGNGAKAIIPVATIEAARELHKKNPTWLLCGERHGHPPTGFMLGNSPLEFTRNNVQGKILILTTSNCTRVFHAAISENPSQITAIPFLMGCLRNLDAVKNQAGYYLELYPKQHLTLLIAGKLGTSSPDDSIAADLLHNSLTGNSHLNKITPKAILEILETSPHGQELLKEGYSKDLQFAAEINTTAVIPVLADDRFVTHD